MEVESYLSSIRVVVGESSKVSLVNMCGRFTLKSTGRIKFDHIDGSNVPPLFPRYNIAPSQNVLTVVQHDGEREAAFAGIWDAWSNRGEALTSCAIITTAANELVGELHDRMPAILLDEFHDAWLDRRTDRTVLTEMLKPFPSLMMKTYPVSSSVNSPDNDTRDLIARVDVEVGQTLNLF